MWLRPHKGEKVPTFDGGPEGAKPSDAEFAKFLDTALGSSFEVETQLLIAKNVGYIAEDIHETLRQKDVEIQRQLSALLSTIRK